MGSAIVDSRLRHAADIMPVSQVREFHRLDHLRLNIGGFNRHLVSEHHGSRAVRSGWGDVDLERDRLIQIFQRLASRLVEHRIAPRDEDQTLNE